MAKSKDELKFDFTVKDLDQMVLDAARGESEQNKGKRPNLLEFMKGKAEPESKGQ